MCLLSHYKSNPGREVRIYNIRTNALEQVNAACTEPMTDLLLVYAAARRINHRFMTIELLKYPSNMFVQSSTLSQQYIITDVILMVGTT
jgi:hypothetical protein